MPDPSSNRVTTRGHPSPKIAAVAWRTRDQAQVILGLERVGPLPAACVLVPNQRSAHALRREILLAGCAEVLAGTLFIPLYAAALAVLKRARLEFTSAEDALRPMRLVSVFRRDLRLSYFELDDLRKMRGWEDAFARTIGDLEAAGCRPSDVSTDEARLRDVGTIWKALEESAGTSWTRARVLTEAASALAADPAHWFFDGPVLAAIGGSATVAEVRFVRAVPNLQVALLAARPMRTDHLARVTELLSAAAAEALRAAAAPRGKETERELLASYLFEPAELLAAGDRPRSGGPDGTVGLEEHAGVEAEIEGAADWVTREVLEKGTPLEDMAILVPTLDPLAGMLVERLGRVPWQDGKLPVHVSGGLPASALAAGARSLAILRGLGAFLSAESLAEVLPALRTTDESRHLSRGAALELAYALGTAGGSPANRLGALDWAARAEKREHDLAALLEKARAAGDNAEQAGLARGVWQVERLVEDLKTVRPALTALVGVAKLFVEGASLAALWPALRDFLATWLLAPGEGAPPHALVDDSLEGACADPACGSLAGEDALRVIEGTLLGLRVPVGRFGDSAVFVGTIASARGIPFTAVRVIGLLEGSLPSAPAEDPVLPETLREKLGAAVPRAADRALAQLHALDQVVRDTRTTIVLSFPRLDLERSQHEPSSVFIEAAAAIGRPDCSSGKAAKSIPGVTDLVRDYFQPARERAVGLRLESPLSEAAWQDRVAVRQGGIPSGWSSASALDLARIRELSSLAAAAAFDGILGADLRVLRLPGLTPERPISASQLTTLLGCPHRFLFERVLGWREPAGPRPTKEIETLSYGSLLHRVAERFYHQHGTGFGRRERSLPEWRHEADRTAVAAFWEFLEEYPLAGEGIRTQQLERLRGDFRTFIEHDWFEGKPRDFVDVELGFGHDEPLAIDLPSGPLYVYGFIDRIDVEDGRILVRDLKSGRSHPRSGKDKAPDHGRDVQVALYGIVAAGLAGKMKLPPAVAAAYAYMDPHDPERAFRSDFAELEKAARGWLDAGARLLREGLFPRTPREDDCRFCPHVPVCGPGVYERAKEVLAGGGDALAAFAAIKGQVAEELDEEED